MSNVVIFKLSSGEEIVGEVVLDSEDTLEVTNTLAVMIRPGNEGYSYGFVPWGAMLDGNKKIRKSAILWQGVPNDDAKNAYSSIFGGVVVPPKQLIV